jgi:hypothetical protein
MLTADALLGDAAALPRARDILTSSRNNNQIALQLGSLSVALCTLGLHPEAARVVGCLTGPHSAYPYWRIIARVAAAWDDIKQALGDDAYEAAVAEGAACSYDELVAWLHDLLERLAPADEPG